MNSLAESNMVSTEKKKKQSTRRLRSQLDKFDRKVSVAVTRLNKEGQNVEIETGQIDNNFAAQNYTEKFFISDINGSELDIQVVERDLTNRMRMEIGIIIDTIENWIQDAISAAMESIAVTELTFRSINLSSTRNIGSFVAYSAPTEQIGLLPLF